MTYDEVQNRLEGAYINKEHRDDGIDLRGMRWARSKAPNAQILQEMITNPDGRCWNRTKRLTDAERVFVMWYCKGAKPASRETARLVVRERIAMEVMES